MLYNIRGVQVDFPYNAYECQLVYMEKVIQALQEGKNALLESPTGTGKTLCLLCSTLAWRQSYVDQLKASIQDGTQSQLTMVPKIIYASRTHSQLAQVVRELKRTSYRIKTSILGSRAQMCIHPTVSNVRGKSQDYMCRSLVSTRKCQFHNAVAQFKANSEFSETICDIEDMVKLGQRYEVCPYYLSKEIQGSADIVFMPYNYLVDPEVRKNLSISLTDSVLIFDEAHNLEGICGDAASFDLSSADLVACEREVQHAIDTALRPGYGGLSSGSGDGISADELAQLKTVLLKLQEVIDTAKFEEGGGLGGGGFTRDGPYIYTLLGGIGITFETHELMVKLIDDVVAMITDESEGVGIHSTIALSQFNSYLKTLFKAPLNHPDHPAQYYKVHIHTDKGRSQNSSGSLFNGKANKKPGKEARTLSYWCFNPGVAMQALQQSGVRSIILTSGTLSPMDSFAFELKTPFPVQLENSHVITKGQVWVGVVGKGPSGQPLNSSYQNRDSTTYKSDLGNAIVNYARIVPNGLLVFFPSYSVLTAALDFWKLPTANSATTIWERICSHKQPVVEPRESYQFPMAIEDFYQKVKDPGKEGGAVFFAVCRGKVSEGLDFADQNGRAVIITGLPYPALDDPKIKLKREYLNNCKLPSGNAYVLRGGEWYTQQASRAINQAVGRVIRHRHDYGAIILCDERFAQRSAQDQLSKWLRPHIKFHNQFGESTMSLIQFFRNANKTTATPPTSTPDLANSPPVTSTTSIGPSTADRPSNAPSSTSSTRSEIAEPRSSLLSSLAKANESAFSKSVTKPPATAPKPAAKLSDQLRSDAIAKTRDSKAFVPPSRKGQDSKGEDSNQTNTSAKAKLPSSSTTHTTKTATPSTAATTSAKQVSASMFNSLAKRELSEENYAKFHTILRDLKTKRISLDCVVQQVRELAPHNIELLEKFIPFIPAKHQEKYRPFLLEGIQLPQSTTSQLTDLKRDDTNNNNNNNDSNNNSNSNSKINNTNKSTTTNISISANHTRSQTQIQNRKSERGNSENDIANEGERNTEGKNQNETNTRNNTNNTETENQNEGEDEDVHNGRRGLVGGGIKNSHYTLPTTTMSFNPPPDLDPPSVMMSFNPLSQQTDGGPVFESPKRMQQYDLISGQPARKKVKVASRSALLTNSANKEDPPDLDPPSPPPPTIPDPEATPSDGPGTFTGAPSSLPPSSSTSTSSNTSTNSSGCVCSICHAKASSPFSARCGHICCHVCWVQWLQEKLECPVCREKTRPRQLTKLYFM